MLSHPLLAENSLFKLVGEIFHPLFELFGLILAGLYAVWPNYGFAITGLTILIMLALTPVTVKSTKSMLAMQRLQPEMKKLQAKYKGPENRETAQPGDDEALQGERDEPVRGLPAQPPADALPHRPVLADPRALQCRCPRVSHIRTRLGRQSKCTQDLGCAAPRYIPTSSQMHHSIGGQSMAKCTGGSGWICRPFHCRITRSLEARARRYWCCRIWCSLVLRCSCSTTK